MKNFQKYIAVIQVKIEEKDGQDQITREEEL